MMLEVGHFTNYLFQSFIVVSAVLSVVDMRSPVDTLL